jgi:mannosyltransferase
VSARLPGPGDGRDRLLAAALAAAVAAILVRAPFLSDSLWYDEIAAFAGYSLDGPWAAMSRYFSTANHVLASVLESICAEAFGVDEVSMRLPSLAAGVATVLAVALLGFEAGGTRLGSVAAGFAAVMPTAVLPSTEARGYALVTLFSALGSACLLRALRGARFGWAAYAAAMALGTWSHLVFACLPAGHAAFLGWRAWTAGRAGDRDDRRRALLGLAAVACAAAATTLLYAPVIGQILHLRAEFRALDGDEPTLLGPEGLWMLLSAGGSWTWWASLAALPLAVAGMAAAARDARLRTGLAVTLAGAAVALLFPTVLGSWMYARFLAFTVPGIAVLLAAGAVALGDRRRWLGWSAALVACTAWVASLATLGPRQQLREAVDAVVRERAPGERAFAVGLPDDVHRWYADLRKVEMPGSGPYGAGMAMHLNDPAMRWCVLLYPRALAERRAELEAAGFEVRARFPGWIDQGDGEVLVLRRR